MRRTPAFDGRTDCVTARSPKARFQIMIRDSSLSVLPGRFLLEMAWASILCLGIPVAVVVVTQKLSQEQLVFVLCVIPVFVSLIVAAHATEVRRGPHMVLTGRQVSLRNGQALDAVNVKKFMGSTRWMLRDGVGWGYSHSVQAELNSGECVELLECSSKKEAKWLVEVLSVEITRLVKKDEESVDRRRPEGIGVQKWSPKGQA